jgi:hypothetical protein
LKSIGKSVRSKDSKPKHETPACPKFWKIIHKKKSATSPTVYASQSQRLDHPEVYQANARVQYDSHHIGRNDRCAAKSSDIPKPVTNRKITWQFN